MDNSFVNLSISSIYLYRKLLIFSMIQGSHKVPVTG